MYSGDADADCVDEDHDRSLCWVLVDRDTGSVKRVDQPPQGEENSDIDADESRFPYDPDWMPDLFRPLKQTPQGAKEWDRQMQLVRPPQFTAPTLGSISPPTAGTALQLDGGANNQLASPESMCEGLGMQGRAGYKAEAAKGSYSDMYWSFKKPIAGSKATGCVGAQTDAGTDGTVAPADGDGSAVTARTPNRWTQKRSKSLGSSPEAIERERTTAEVNYFGDRDHFVVLGNDLAPEECNRDWTCSRDENVWWSRNNLRYDMMREALLQGRR